MKTTAWFLFAVWITCDLAATCLAQDVKRPNILFILADDLGWHDLGCYGEELFETPHLDRMAAAGLRFTQAYAPAPICSASRAAFQTGKTPARLGFEFVTKNRRTYQPVLAPLRGPLLTLNLPLDEVTMAECLGEAGYETGFFGKWHLNQHYRRYLGWSPSHGPPRQGYQFSVEDFGCHPYSYWSDPAERLPLDLPQGDFPSDTMVNKGIEFLLTPRQQPCLLVVSHFFVHTPVHTRVQWLREHYLARIPDNHPRRAQLADYAAMVTTLDRLVGRMLAAVEAAGLSKSTLIIFTSDNGGHPNYAGNAPLCGSKWNLYEGGIRVPMHIPNGQAMMNKLKSSSDRKVSAPMFRNRPLTSGRLLRGARSARQ